MHGGGGRIFIKVKDGVNFYSKNPRVDFDTNLLVTNEIYDLDEILPLISSNGHYFQTQNMSTNSGTLDITLGKDHYLILANNGQYVDSKDNMATVVKNSLVNPDLNFYCMNTKAEI